MSTNFIAIIQQQQFQDWKGIATAYSLEKTKKDFKVIHETQSTLGILAQKATPLFVEEQAA